MRKAQAAIEFLMTYGWAILAAIVVIGVLAYFGVFSPKSYVPTTCILSAPLGCDKNQVAATANSVVFVMRNGGVDALTVNTVNVTGCGSNTTAFIISPDASYTVGVPCNSANLTSGDKFKGDVLVRYIVSGGAFNQTSTGSVVVKVT